MNIRTLKPTSQREWTMVGLGALAAMLILALATSRFEYRDIPAGEAGNPSFLRIDHWTGSAAVCYVVCHAVQAP